MNYKYIFAALCLSLGVSNSLADNIISTESSSSILTIGARFGVNSSNRTFPNSHFSAWNVNSWGTGIDAGVIVGINLRDYFSIQPGIFFESRSSNYSYSEPYVNNQNKDDFFTQLGHVRTYNLVVPVMLSVKINVADNLRWVVEAGPYAQFKLHSSDNDQIEIIDQPTPQSPIKVEYAKSHFYDYGLKVGTGLLIKDHYSFNIHYLAGARDVWGSPKGGLNKAWTFTIGYEFGLIKR